MTGAGGGKAERDQGYVEKRHPWFERRVTTLMITAAIGGGLLITNQLGLLGPVLLSPAVGIGLVVILVAGSIGYGFWAAARIRCPECSSRCERPGGSPGGRRAVCRKCGIVWDLGVSFSMKDE